MNSKSCQTLITDSDPPPVVVLNPGGASPFLLIGDHAGNAVPSALGSLGLTDRDMGRHIAWDIGVAGLGAQLATMLDAAFIRQAYSRLVIDCNRDPIADDSIPEISDGTTIPANVDLTQRDRAARIAEIHAVYHAAIAAELARRDDAGRDTVLISLHSFTPEMQGIARPWEIGVLHSSGNGAFARATLRQLQMLGHLTVGDNQPYAMDGIDYTVPRHAFAAARPYVEIEIRQDLLASHDRHVEWARMLAEIFETVLGTRP